MMRGGILHRLLRLTGLTALVLCGLAIASLQAQGQTVTYIHTDALGSVVAKSDASGKVIERISYEPYGAVVGAPVADGPGYTGHVSDAATGLSQMQQRYMDPQLGMFLSIDPVTAYEQPVGQFNRYRYANSNPYKFTDPDGQSATLLIPIVVIPIVVATTYYATTSSEQRADLGNKLESAVRGVFQKSESTPQQPALQGDGSIASEGASGNRFPDRALPTKPSGEPAPDPDAGGPHTQLGQKEGRNGKYDQAREFDGRAGRSRQSTLLTMGDLEAIQVPMSILTSLTVLVGHHPGRRPGHSMEADRDEY
jgi:RHS repeat-associated protein